MFKRKAEDTKLGGDGMGDMRGVGGRGKYNRNKIRNSQKKIKKNKKYFSKIRYISYIILITPKFL